MANGRIVEAGGGAAQWRLLAAGNAMCGIVTYHGGVKYPMAAQHRVAATPPSARR